MVKISTSILSIKDNFFENIKKLNDTTTDYLHIDIMDGYFTSNTSFSFDTISKTKEITTKPLDIHLMVKNPFTYINSYKNLNPEYITIHKEIDNLDKFINLIKSYNIKVGVSIKPKTKVEEIYNLLNKIDLVLIMSVEPGMGGQLFIDGTLTKVKKLKEYIEKNNLKTKISIDGGINNINSSDCILSGCDILVSGSYITNSTNYEEKIQSLR